MTATQLKCAEFGQQIGVDRVPLWCGAVTISTPLQLATATAVGQMEQSTEVAGGPLQLVHGSGWR
jgi:hypothetical protein